MAQELIADLNINLIDIGPEQSRVRNIDHGINELAQHIDRYGLLQPIVVFRRDDRFVLVCGQRRLLAYRTLGKETIPANVIDMPEDAIEAKAISFAENYLRIPLVERDIIDACMAFYHRYGSMREAARRLRLPYDEVREYVRREELPQELVELVDDSRVNLSDAVRAQRAAQSEEGEVDIEKAVHIALELPHLTTDQRKELPRKAKEMPSATTEELMEEVKKPPRIVRYGLTLAILYAEGVQTAANGLKRSEEEVIELAVVDWLVRSGYA